jgi:hypothetical protein
MCFRLPFKDKLTSGLCYKNDLAGPASHPIFEVLYSPVTLGEPLCVTLD